MPSLTNEKDKLNRMRVRIIGGGFAGMTTTYKNWANSGTQLFCLSECRESADLPELFKFSQRLVEGDIITGSLRSTDIIAQMGELVSATEFQWIPSRTGWFDHDKIWNMVSPLDLMRLGTLPFIDRVRLGASVGYLTYLQQNRTISTSTNVSPLPSGGKNMAVALRGTRYGVRCSAGNSATARSKCRWFGTGTKSCCASVHGAD